MKSYWDTSALIEVILESQDALNSFGESTEKVTRCHSLAEAYSQLTGGRLGFRLLPAQAARLLSELASTINVVSLNPAETIRALGFTEKRGIRGGAIHDFLHAYAAEVHGCERIVTCNHSDFARITHLEVRSP